MDTHPKPRPMIGRKGISSVLGDQSVQWDLCTYVRSLLKIKTPKLFGITSITLCLVRALILAFMILSYTPMIIVQMETRKAQIRPSHPAGEPP